MIAQTEKERETLREGGARLGSYLAVLKRMAKPGISTLFLEEEAQKLIGSQGDKASFFGYMPDGARRPYPAALCVSVNDAIVHGIPNEDPEILNDGDVVTLDMGLTHDGLVTDAAVCLVVGNAAPDEKRLLQCAREALDAGIAEARVGNTLGDIGYAIETVGKQYKLNGPRELGGHSVGARVHEEPFIPNFGKRGTGPKITEGMVLAIEPMFMLGRGAIFLDADGYTYRTRDGSKSAHVEHTVLVTAQGPEILTHPR